MSTITKEFAQDIIKGHGYGVAPSAVEVLARMALAAMDSEPVAVPDHLTYLQSPTLENVLSDAEENSPLAHAARILAREVKFWRSVPLYRHAQPAPELTKPIGFINGSREPALYGEHIGIAIGTHLYTAPQPARTGVDDDVRNIIGLLETNEWAEHCTETVLGSRLEAEITRLIGCAPPAPVVPDEVMPGGLVYSSALPKFESNDSDKVVGYFCFISGETRSVESQEQAYADAKAVVNACRAAMLKAGNSPAIGIDPASGPDLTVEVRYVAPPGYVMVPKEPTDEMIAAAMNCDDVLFNSDESFCVQFGNIYEAMLAAAPTGIPMNSNAWIPVSERMPETDGNYWGWWSESKRQGPVWFIKSELQAQFQSHEITHWMPLPAAPQGVNNG